MLILFIFANARENNDSVDDRSKDQKPEIANIFVAEETSIYRKEIIYNANYIVERKNSRQIISFHSIKISPEKQNILYLL